MRAVFSILFWLVAALPAAAADKKVNNPAELKEAVERAAPGDRVILASGEWKDAGLILHGKGSAAKPLCVMPEKPGSVLLSGNSFLKISGEYIVVKGLHFNNGYTADGDVIEFRTSNSRNADNCRLTETVIENFSKPEKFKNDNWVVLFGRNNRVDHCTFVNKLNLGPTMVVELNDERSQQNHHSIDSNYFKGRQRLGSNGGETIRVGVSKYSLTSSNTNIKYNYFERCNGEVEVVSVKSGGNQVSFNTFYECEGSLVLRHGANNVVEGNLFHGNNKAFTGGVRVINPGHRVFNNVFKDLKGIEFRSALAVMNGVPNSLINRYHQVKDADIYNNTFINCSNIEFGAGKDAERTAAPENVRFRNNLLADPAQPLYKDNNGAGIIFSGNLVVSGTKNSLPDGFRAGKPVNKIYKGISLPQASVAGADISRLPLLKKDALGAGWYKPSSESARLKGKRIPVSGAEASALQQVLNDARPGDTVLLTEAGIYSIISELLLTKPVCIQAADAVKGRVILVNGSEKTLPAFFTIEEGGSLNVRGLIFAGSYESYGDVQAGIRTSTKGMLRPYTLHIDNCEFHSFNEGSYSAFKASKGSYADSLVLRNCIFRNMSGTALDLSAEREDKGIYNAEYTIIQNCLFTNILGAALNLYRGGNDESTTGPFLEIDHCTFNEVDNREQGSALRLPGVQHAMLTNCIFNQSGQGGRSVFFQEYAKDELRIDFCNLYQSGKIESFYNKVTGANMYSLAPLFADPASGDFSLSSASPLKGKSSAGGDPGITVKFKRNEY